MIKAEAHSDDRNVEVEFDVTPWFQQASDGEIRELARCGWGGDYPADEVARFFETKTREMTRLFEYLELVREDWSKKDLRGFECHVDPEDAMQWLKKKRQRLNTELAEEGH